jgi:serine protease inhibitor
MRAGPRISALLAAAATLALLGGCASGPAPVPAPKVARGMALVVPNADARPFGAADTSFGLDVLGAWCKSQPDANLVFSPTVLASALGMAYLGAHGETAARMARVLHLPNAPAAGAGSAASSALLAGLHARLAALRAAAGPGVTLAASDQVWADPALPPLTPYLNSVATGYDAGVGQAPFLKDPSLAAGQINAAIARDTRGQITRLVTADMLDGIGWVLTSALYMDAAWDSPFNAQDTQPGTFTPASGGPVTAQYMHGYDYAAASAGGWTGVSLPYQGGRLAMLALLPPAAAGNCALPAVTDLTAIASAARGTGAGQVAIAFPKASIGSNARMDAELKALGMAQAFDGSADFTGLSPKAAMLGFVQQAATLKIGEKGTVAAAAAAVGIVASAGRAVTREVDFNRPYLLLVTDTRTGEPLFLAKVANPA